MPDHQIGAMLKEPNVAQVATVSATGRPNVSTVWYLYENEKLWLATTRQTVKGKSMVAGSPVSICICDRRDYYRQLLIKGEVVDVLDDEDMQVCDRISQKYIGRPFPNRGFRNRIALGILPIDVKYREVDLSGKS